ncbi:LysR family transcriptional regulator [Aquipuribacter sp. SD81]|uniref:LysR family transcriptional regulator n=1 Tax=Aquipuribacter sp. SD81 TaxID=3127703 RepID=UPI0030196E56
MELRHLELLRDLAALGSLTRVAAATHRTPSALSQQLRVATREAGVPLVEPFARGLRLTAEGRLLADGADEVLAASARLRARLEAVRGEPAGRVVVDTLPSAGTVLLPALVHRLRGSAVVLDLDDHDLAEADVAARTVHADVVIGHSPTTGPPQGSAGLAVRVLAHEPLDVALPVDHPLADRASLAPSDLAGTRWVGVPPGYPFDTILLGVEQRLGAPLERVVRIRDNQLVRALVAAGTGLAVLPRFSTAPGDDVVLRPLVDVHASRSIVALCRPDRLERLAVRTVVAHLVEIGAAVDAGRTGGAGAVRGAGGVTPPSAAPPGADRQR